jgi:hypothetical protein
MMLRSAVSGAMTQASPDHAGAWRRLPLVLTISLLLLSNACTSTAPERSTPMPLFDSVAIVSNGATRDLKARFGVAPEDKIAEEGMIAGAGAGMAAGAAWAAVCGPWFFICAMGTVPAGAVVGATAGGLAGAASDAHKTPPDEQLLALDKLFADIYQRHTLHMEIRDTLEKQIPPDWLADTSEAGALVQLKLSDVRFTRTFSGKYEWTLKSIMVVTWNRNTGRTRHSYKFYDYASRALTLDDWMKNDGAMLNTALDESVEGLAEKMAVDIRFKD